MAAEVLQRGGRVSRTDLAAYRVIHRRPVTAAYRGHDVVSNAPPSAGGVLIAYALRLLDRLGVAGAPGTPAAIGRLAEVARASTRAREGRFTSDLHRGGLAATAARRRGCRARRPGDPLRRGPPGHAGAGGPAVDDSHQRHRYARERGFTVFVDGMRVRGDRARDWYPSEQHARGAGPESIREGGGPGTPPDEHDGTDGLLLRNGRPRLVLGSAGSERLRGAIVQTIVNVVDHGLGLRQAIDTPRVHLDGGDLHLEGGTRLRWRDQLRGVGIRRHSLARPGPQPLLRRSFCGCPGCRRRARGRGRSEARRCGRGRRVTVTIRAARPRDASALVELAQSVGAEPEGWLIADGEWRSVAERAATICGPWPRSRHVGVFVAESEGRIVGRLTIARDGHPASRHVADVGLMVARSARGRGSRDCAARVGRRAGLEPAGSRRSSCTSSRTTCAAIALYESLGYRREGYRTSAFPSRRRVRRCRCSWRNWL